MGDQVISFSGRLRAVRICTFATAITGLAVMGPSLTSPVAAATTSVSIQRDLAYAMAELHKAYPEASEAVLREAVQSWKPSNGTLLDAAVFLLNARSPKHPLVLQAQQAPQALKSGGSNGNVDLPVGRGKGDLFAHTASHAGPVAIGHAGMWSTKQNVVHATGVVLPGGAKQGPVIQPRSAVKMPIGHSALMWVSTSSAVREVAVAFAKSKVGKGYNTNYIKNKTINADSYNCSQLVWAAYKAQGIELDGGGLFGNSFVSPGDIIGASETYEYQRI